MRLLLGGLLLAGGLTVAGPLPAQAAGVGDCSQTDDTVIAQGTTRTSPPLSALHVAQAQALLRRDGRLPGRPVNVAVLDSGISTARRPHPLPVVDHYAVPGANGQVVDYHGTAVAGLVAGRPRGVALTGIAPDVGLVDVQVWGWPQGAQRTPAPLSSENLAAGLRWVAAHAARDHIDVAVVSLAATRAPVLADAVRRVERAGVLLVAASGNRPDPTDPGPFPQYAKVRPGQDAVHDIYPAGYPGVVAAATTYHDLDALLPNSATDIAVPTAGGISVALNGGDCVLTAPATSWSAAEIGGVAALLFKGFPGEDAAQVRARLLATASGTAPDGSSPAGEADVSLYFGRGVAQPVEALTRPLSPSPDGSLPLTRPQRDRTPPATAPVPDADALAHTRRLAIWGGLIGFGGLLVAAVLRPLLTRRRAH